MLIPLLLFSVEICNFVLHTVEVLPHSVSVFICGPKLLTYFLVFLSHQLEKLVPILELEVLILITVVENSENLVQLRLRRCRILRQYTESVVRDVYTTIANLFITSVN